MLDKLEELKQKAALELGGITEDSGLEAWRVRYLGKKSELTQVLRGIAALPLEEKKTVGAAANDLRVNLEAVLEQKKQALAEANMTRLAMQESIDITLPGRPQPHGRLHPLTQTLYEISDIFVSMGFGVVEGPDVEWNYYNFEALNIPHHHPARDSMSTFWVDTGDGGKAKDVLLRTHTTAVDIRVMEKVKPPIRIVIPGRVYRYEASDATHTPMFHQIDGLAVGKNITMADLKGTLYEFSRRYFGADRKVRFRCDYFPFVEPGVEMAVECGLCRGAGCRLCGNTGWIEIAGAGMTHPDVLRRVGLDPEEYTSFAFGMGIDRLPMLRYGIDDIRLYFGSDLRFLKQF